MHRTPNPKNGERYLGGMSTNTSRHSVPSRPRKWVFFYFLTSLKKILDKISQNLYNIYITREEPPMEKVNQVTKLYNLIEMFGEEKLIREWLCYCTTEELKEFVEHCEEYYKVDASCQ